MFLTVPAWLGAADVSGGQPVTFAKDIAPILQAKCQNCHRAGQMAPMSLVTYEEARPWAKAIKQRVLTRQMPPWHVDPTIGIQKFKNDLSLSDDPDRRHRQVGGRWRAPRQRRQDMPPPKQWPDDGRLEAGREVRPTGFGDQIRTLYDGGQGSRRLVQAADRHSGHRAALGPRRRNPPRHRRGPQDHASCSRFSGSRTSPAGYRNRCRPRDAFLMEWAVSKSYDVYRENTGKLLLPGRAVSWDDALPRRRRRDSRRRRAGDLSLPERPGTQVPHLPNRLPALRGSAPRFAPRRLGVIDIPPNSHYRERGLSGTEAARDARKFPAAHAPARQGHAAGGDFARRLQRTHQLRRATSTSTG